jgi:hypothetical protein
MARTRIDSAGAAFETARFLYRGVHAQHPALKEAMQGRVAPGNIYGVFSPDQHNRGGVSEMCPYTSWTAERKVAEYHARRFGPGGVILKLPPNDPERREAWSWEQSPDIFEEQEILLRRPRSGATFEFV